ncbi:lipopolysaccharide kinase InaA family protein, partial [Nitratifractor sp.]
MVEGDIRTIHSLANKTPDIRQKYSELIFDGGYALKKIYPQKPADYFRRPFKSQGKREALSSHLMRRHGIHAPTIFAWGWAIFSPSGYDSFVLMEQVENQGSLDEILKKTIDKKLRKDIIGKIGRDLRIM